MRPVRFHPDARQELLTAVRFYRGEHPALASAFASEIRIAAERVSEFPRSGVATSEASQVRRALLDRFPSALVYRPTDGAIETLAVVHQNRRPGYWRGRAD